MPIWPRRGGHGRYLPPRFMTINQARRTIITRVPRPSTGRASAGPMPGPSAWLGLGQADERIVAGTLERSCGPSTSARKLKTPDSDVFPCSARRPARRGGSTWRSSRRHNLWWCLAASSGDGDTAAKAAITTRRGRSWDGRHIADRDGHGVWATPLTVRWLEAVW